MGHFLRSRSLIPAASEAGITRLGSDRNQLELLPEDRQSEKLNRVFSSKRSADD
jgi:hypothetical protein